MRQTDSGGERKKNREKFRQKEIKTHKQRERWGGETDRERRQM